MTQAILSRKSPQTPFYPNCKQALLITKRFGKKPQHCPSNFVLPVAFSGGVWAKRCDGAVALMWLGVKANTGTALKHQPRAVLQ